MSKKEIRNHVVGIRVTEGELGIIGEYCNNVGMTPSDVGRMAILQWLSSDKVLGIEHEKFVNKKIAEMRRSIYEEHNEIIMRYSKEIKHFENDLKELIDEDSSNLILKQFITNKINSIIETIVNINDVEEGKKLLERVYNIVAKWRPHLVVKGGKKTLTLTLNSDTYNMLTLYYNRKKVKTRIKGKKQIGLKENPRYKKKLKEIKDVEEVPKMFKFKQ